MGGRGAFVDVNLNDFQFTDGGQAYQTIGEVDGIQILVQNKGAVKAPEFSHTENGIPVSSKELEMIRKIKRRFNLR
jgi:hypothetical protein